MCATDFRERGPFCLPHPWAAPERPISIGLWGHSFSTYAAFSKKLLFLTPWYAQVFVSGVRNGSVFGRFCEHTTEAVA